MGFVLLSFPSADFGPVWPEAAGVPSGYLKGQELGGGQLHGAHCLHDLAVLFLLFLLFQFPDFGLALGGLLPGFLKSFSIFSSLFMRISFLFVTVNFLISGQMHRNAASGRTC